ncbi:MAG: hypothetical protein ACI9G1_001739 [Pirellulaceae bacterium]|jgi:hypothetical protein
MRTLLICLVATTVLWTANNALVGQEPDPADEKSLTVDPPAKEAEATEGLPESQQFNENEEKLPPLPEPIGLNRLAKDYRVWADLKRKLVIVDGYICLQRGQLEMFACPKQSKEHESVVAIDCPARYIHAGLLLVGAKAGQPVQFDPQYAPAMGDVIEVLILWKDKDGKGHKVRAQQWIRDTSTEKEMSYDWVFGGSGFWTDPETKEQHYYADDGDFICVSNFGTAMLDLPIKSSQLSDGLLFECFPDRIPPRKTPVRLVLRLKNPVKKIVDDKEDTGQKKGDEPNSAGQQESNGDEAEEAKPAPKKVADPVGDLE